MANCSNCQQSFEISAADQSFYQKIQVPTPTLCPDCRQQRRLAFRNESKLYQRKCALCGKQIISVFHPDSDLKVYCQECWWSDKWNALDFGRDFNFSRPFFEQFAELKKAVPVMALLSTSNENADYVNLSGYNKNCYLLFAAEYNEDCLYGNQVIKCNTCLDSLECTESEYCYEVAFVNKCYDLFFSEYCKNCNESMFLFDCKNCNSCLFCSNLRGKNFQIFNKPCSPEEFKQSKKAILAKLNQGKAAELLEQFAELKRNAIHKNLELLNTENSLGNNLIDSKNCQHCYDLSHAEDCLYAYSGFGVKDIMDICHTTEVEIGYEGTSIGYKSYNVLFSCGSWSTKNSQYIDQVHSSSDCFACAGLQRNNYCLFNKRYEQKTFEELREKIISHMRQTGEYGEFFPISMSAFAYNETVANEYFPLSKEEALSKGYAWRDPDPKEYQESNCQLADDISDVADSITDKILACQECQKNYRIVKSELKFYRQHGLPIPKACPECRHKVRTMSRRPRQLWERSCDKCHAPVQSVFTPDFLGKVYCEKCYNDSVY